MKMFGKATLIGMVLDHPNSPEEAALARLFSDKEGFKIHWHDEEGLCHEQGYSTPIAALYHAKVLGITHVIIGASGTAEEAVPLVEAFVLGKIDGGLAFESPLSGNNDKYIH